MEIFKKIEVNGQFRYFDFFQAFAGTIFLGFMIAFWSAFGVVGNSAIITIFIFSILYVIYYWSKKPAEAYGVLGGSVFLALMLLKEILIG